MKQNIEIEYREATGELFAQILQEGRASTGSTMREVFAPGSLVWPSTGVQVRLIHLGASEAVGFPSRDNLGRVTVRVKATEAIRKAVQAGKKYASIEFKSLREKTTRGGIREIASAFLDAFTLTDSPEYGDDVTAAELREKKKGGLETWL